MTTSSSQPSCLTNVMFWVTGSTSRLPTVSVITSASTWPCPVALSTTRFIRAKVPSSRCLHKSHRLSLCSTVPITASTAPAARKTWTRCTSGLNTTSGNSNPKSISRWWTRLPLNVLRYWWAVLNSVCWDTTTSIKSLRSKRLTWVVTVWPATPAMLQKVSPSVVMRTAHWLHTVLKVMPIHVSDWN